MNILIVGGSPRANSNTAIVVQAVERILELTDHRIATFHVGELPLFTDHENDEAHSAVQRWRKLAQEADAFVICTPEYHNGMSGAMKNALDFLSSRQFKGKPVTIIAASGGGKGGMNALSNLRIVLRGVYALVLPEQAVVDETQIAPERDGLLPAAEERLKQILQSLLEIAKKLGA